MPENEKIRSGFLRVATALAQRPAFGHGTGCSKATIRNGLTCEVREGSWTLIADMPEQAGGNGAGPTPGVYGRAALGSCLAIGYMMRAAMMDIPVASLEVEVQADYNDGALFGTAAGVAPGAAGLAAQKGETRARFARLDAEDLALEDGTFDVVLCALGLMYMPSPLTALKEMYRVLKPSGRLIATVWGQRQHCGWADIFEIVDRHVSSEVCPMFFSLGNPGALELHLKAAGFSDIGTRGIQTTLHFTDAKHALGAAFDGGPVALAYHKFSVSVKELVHTDYLASLAPYKKGEGYEVPGEFVLAEGKRL